MIARLLNHRTIAPILAALIVLSISAGIYAAGKHSGGHGDAHDKAAASNGHSNGHGHADSHGHAATIGMPGKAAEATRSIQIIMTDNRYSPEKISVKKGETIRFVIKNEGELVHEFNIGTPKMHVAHQKEMEMMVEHGVLEADKINHARMKMDMGGGKTMEHNDPNSALLEPGKSGEIIWTFTKNSELEFACNVPGHYDAGMVGKLHIN